MTKEKVVKIKDQKRYRLTAKQEQFANLVVNPDYTLIKAYKETYATSANDNACSVEANRLINNPKVALRVAELKAKIDAKTLLEGSRLQRHLKSKLLALSTSKSEQVQLRAIEMLCRTEAMFSDKQINIEEKASEQIEQELIERLNRIA